MPKYIVKMQWGNYDFIFSNIVFSLVALIPLCENMPSGTAFKPGDIVTAMNGKTIEVKPNINILCNATMFEVVSCIGPNGYVQQSKSSLGGGKVFSDGNIVEPLSISMKPFNWGDRNWRVKWSYIVASIRDFSVLCDGCTATEHTVILKYPCGKLKYSRSLPPKMPCISF